jgi:glutamate racemase
MKIGVFDSGIGGQAVATAIRAALPDLEVILREDRQHVPYGSRDPEEILGFVVPIFQSMIDEGCRVIVVACNTVTTTLIQDLRQRFTIPLVGIEPMVKPAAEISKTKVIAVCATPATLSSKRYRELKQKYAADVKVLEPDCSDWTVMIEEDSINLAIISERINHVLSANADVIVLGCTHYHWIEEDIKQLAAGKAAKVIQPTAATIEQLKRVLARLR